MTSTRISRREFLGMAAGAGAVLAGSGLGLSAHKVSGQTLPGGAAVLPLFVDQLPDLQPPIDGTQPVSLSMQQSTHRFHRDMPPTTVWGYYPGYLGQTIEAVNGQPTTVVYNNNLPTDHLLRVDPTIVQMRGKPNITRTLTHLHGGHIDGQADGNPWATPNEFRPNGPPQTVTYRNDQEAAHLWYHEHALGITRLNVMAGLAANYILRDSVDDGNGGNFGDSGKLPFNSPDGGTYEIPLVIQDKAFTRRGRIDYPAQWTPEFFGDVTLVNGKMWPNLQVDKAKYRFRMLNGSNSRFYHLQLTQGTMTQIGTDGGLLNEPVEGLQSILLAPAERADVIIDFSGSNAGDQIRLTDSPLPDGTVSPATPLARSEVMQFTVTDKTGPADVLPTTLRSEPFSVAGPVAQTRYLTLEEVLAGPIPRAVLLNGLHFHDPVTETPALNTTEDWWLINLSADTHPIHVHLVQFEIMQRRNLDVAQYQADLDAARTQAGGPIGADGQLVNPALTENHFLPGEPSVDANEKGPKDTVRANPMQATRIRAHFDIAGKYVWHCHILEHEDNDMMRPYDVV